MKYPGLFITFEGIDGSGKTTQVNFLVNRLNELSKKYRLFREPGGTYIGEKIRDILLDRNNSELFPVTELLLYSASRYQLTKEKIIPSLIEGYIVICDRFYDSTTAYQGYGRGLNLEFIEELNKFASCNIEPDITFLIDVSIEERYKRLKRKMLDRLEIEDRDFHEKVREGFLQLAQKNKHRVVVIDGNRPAEEVFASIEKKLINTIKKRGL
ncbi:MAG: dTMP kinase [Candidatus Marinimicrobia bacterium]|nr:dTMP kinase [Candidatus Neomarinimicrobiota bacterium]